MLVGLQSSNAGKPNATGSNHPLAWLRGSGGGSNLADNKPTRRRRLVADTHALFNWDPFEAQARERAVLVVALMRR